MRKVLRIAVAALVLLPALAVIPAQAMRPEGCVSPNPGLPEYPSKCTYTATEKGGIAGEGTWKVIIIRGTKKIVYTQKRGYSQPIGVIRPRDKVTTIALQPGSLVAAGNPCPPPAPATCANTPAPYTAARAT